MFQLRLLSTKRTRHLNIPARPLEILKVLPESEKRIAIEFLIIGIPGSAFQKHSRWVKRELLECNSIEGHKGDHQEKF